MRISIKLYKEPRLRNPALVAGWPGMGDVAMAAVSYLVHKLEAEDFGEIEPFDFYEPMAALVENGVIQPPKFPTSKFFFWRNPSSSGDLIIFVGEAQPSRRGYELAGQVLDVAERFSVNRIYTFAAAPTAIHHRAKPKVLAVANDSKLLDGLRAQPITLMGGGHISGMNGMLLGVAAERRLEGVCLLGELPYYTIGIPNPKSSQVVLELLGKLLNIEIDLADIEAWGKQIEEQVDKVIKSSEQMERYIARFESAEGPSPEEFRGMAEAVEREINLRHHVEVLFSEASRDRSKIDALKAELDRLGLFQEYQDRFLNLFKKGGQ
jgi:hypothetical protein